MVFQEGASLHAAFKISTTAGRNSARSSAKISFIFRSSYAEKGYLSEKYSPSFSFPEVYNPDYAFCYFCWKSNVLAPMLVYH